MEISGLNSQDDRGYSELHAAVHNGNLDSAYKLLEAGADVNVKRRDGYSVLHTAAAEGYTDLVIALIEKGAEVNAKRTDGETPLHSAVCMSHPDCAQQLIKHGASVNLPFLENDMTALHIAVIWSSNCIEVLLNANANAFAMNKYGMCPLDLAMENGLDCFMKFCPDKLNLCSNDGVTALHIASRCLNIECLIMLIQNTCNLNVATKEGDTPLHYACHLAKIIHHEVLVQMEFYAMRNVEILLRAGACINKQNNAGCTPLHLCVKLNFVTVTEHLLDRGADINIRGGEKSQTVLHIASQNGNLSLIKLLLEKGADKTAVNADNHTALMLAAKGVHFACVKFLLQNDVPFFPVR